MERFKGLQVAYAPSKCGYTPQFEKLEGMYKKYKDKGLMVVGFPSNDFKQELDTNKEIGDFCRLTYSVDFPMIEKSAVSGPAADPFYKQLAEATGQPPRWNFHKYLIMPGGTQVYVKPSGRATSSTSRRTCCMSPSIGARHLRSLSGRATRRPRRRAWCRAPRWTHGCRNPQPTPINVCLGPKADVSGRLNQHPL